ncbi:unnamed protein product, partial [Iphiclides podalirius]
MIHSTMNICNARCREASIMATPTGGTQFLPHHYNSNGLSVTFKISKSNYIARWNDQLKDTEPSRNFCDVVRIVMDWNRWRDLTRARTTTLNHDMLDTTIKKYGQWLFIYHERSGGRFIPPAAPFMGGAWERLIRSVKNAHTATLHERHPNEEVLSTLLAEVEYTVNSRPLIHVSVTAEDPEALTPNHFLLGGNGRVPQPGTFNENDEISRASWRAAQRLADVFWSRWVREYLPELQHRREPHGRGLSVQSGDLVQIVDANLPRNVWPRGKVVATYPGPDNIVRTVDVQTRARARQDDTTNISILSAERCVSPAPPIADSGRIPTFPSPIAVLGRAVLDRLRSTTLSVVSVTSGADGEYPAPLDVAPLSLVAANATCADSGAEEFCRDTPGKRGVVCDVCEGVDGSPSRRHPAALAVDGDPATWWQSPTQANGEEFAHVELVAALPAESPRNSARILSHLSTNDLRQTTCSFRVMNDPAEVTFVPAPPRSSEGSGNKSPRPQAAIRPR